MNTIIFDLDGTLLNTLDDLYISFNYAINYFGYPKRTKPEIREFIGNGIRKAIERALPNKVSEEEFEKIVILFKDYYSMHMFENTKPYDGIIELLKELKKRNYKIGVVSNKYHDAVNQHCSMYFAEFVDCAVGEGYGIERKPSPNGIYKVIEELHSDIRHTIYAGDSEVDIMTAKNANIPCISVLWGFKDKEFLKKNGGNIFAEKAEDIIEILEKISKNR